jgi:hypothetical protein
VAAATPPPGARPAGAVSPAAGPAARRGGALGLAALVLAGCAPATLPYVPARQPAGVVLSAAYRVAGDRLRVELDTGGYRVEWAEVVRPDASAARAETLAPPGAPAGGPEFGIGVGVGSSRRTGSVGVGGGVGVGATLGGASRRGDTTVAVFPLDAAGPAPWRVRVKAVGIEPVEIVLDPARRG